MTQLLDHTFWLSLVGGWREEVNYPSLWGQRAQMILLLPEGPSPELLNALQCAESIGDVATVDWAIDELKSEGHSVNDFEAIRGPRIDQMEEA